MKKRVHVFYNGRVQGVGFRFTAEEAAESVKGVTGWVKNLSDSRVEMVAEGEAERLTQLLERIRTGPMQAYIRDVKVVWEPYRGEFHDFGIHF